MKKQKAAIPFLEYNLRGSEEVLLTARPPKGKQIARSFITNTIIPFPIAWFWGFIDFSILFGVTIGLGGGDPMIFIIIPFIAVHNTPFWIYLYGVIKQIRNFLARGYIITNQRVLYRMERGKPFESKEISNMETVQLANVSSVTSLKVFIEMKPSFNGNQNSFTIEQLTKSDSIAVYEILEDILAKRRKVENKIKYKAKCDHCGGKTEDGRCMYCGMRAELRQPEKEEKATSPSSASKVNPRKGGKKTTKQDLSIDEQEALTARAKRLLEMEERILSLKNRQGLSSIPEKEEKEPSPNEQEALTDRTKKLLEMEERILALKDKHGFSNFYEVDLPSNTTPKRKR